MFGKGALSTGLTADQKQALSGLSGEERSRMEAQFNMQNKAEVVSFISNVMKMKHDIQMSVINNIRV
jgi:hypothetical protein